MRLFVQPFYHDRTLKYSCAILNFGYWTIYDAPLSTYSKASSERERIVNIISVPIPTHNRCHAEILTQLASRVTYTLQIQLILMQSFQTNK